MAKHPDVKGPGNVGILVSGVVYLALGRRRMVPAFTRVLADCHDLDGVTVIIRR